MAQKFPQIGNEDYQEYNFTYAYSGGNSNLTGRPVEEEKTYTYGSGEWTDLLVGVNGKEITYDGIGNPLKYMGMTMSWSRGRNLNMVKLEDGTRLMYSYDDNGLRTSKRKDGKMKTIYLDESGRVIAEDADYDSSSDRMLLYEYDATGRAVTVTDYLSETQNFTYYYMYNGQGDVIGLMMENGSIRARYEYDAWGNMKVLNGSGNDLPAESTGLIGNMNPFRYRGYYYDVETGFYYLQSRYSLCDLLAPKPENH